MHLPRDIASLDLYELLRVPREATPSEVRRAYRQRVRESHPDLCPSDTTRGRRMRDVNLAARVLLDPAARGAYDAQRALRERTRDTWWGGGAPSDDGEWVTPPVAERPAEPSERYGQFLGELRGSPSRAGVSVQDWLGGIPPYGRLALGSFGLCIALILLASAPFAEERPVSVSPAALSP